MLKVHYVDIKDQIETRLETDINEINKLNNHYRCHGESDFESSMIWQQMSIEFFYNLLNKNKLFFRRMNEYDSKDERSIEFFKTTYQNYLGPNNKKKIIIDDFSNTVYLSCWYHSDNLTDVIFKEYTKGSAGVAIGTDVQTLIENIQHNDENELMVGDVVYLSDKVCETKVLTNLSDLITPLFLKSENHNDDREFRLVYLANSYYQNNGRFSNTSITEAGKKKKTEYLKVDIHSLIKYIAVRKDDNYTLELTKYLFKQFFENYSLVEEKYKTDGFQVFKLEVPKK